MFDFFFKFLKTGKKWNAGKHIIAWLLIWNSKIAAARVNEEANLVKK